MILFGPLHVSLLLATIAISGLLAYLARRGHLSKDAARLGLGCGLALNEFGWWYFRYSHEGVHLNNLPFQLCDLSVWATVLACLTLKPLLVEAAYFAGIAGAGMALVTPDLWSPWPTYPAIYFFAAHGGIVIANAVLIYGRIGTLRPGALWRGFGWLLAFAVFVGLFDAAFTTNYMYLRAKPKSATLLDAFGPWPIYLAVTFGIALLLYGVLWQAARFATRGYASES